MTATLTFDDEFNSLSLWNGSSGTWDTNGTGQPLDGNGFSLSSNGEQEWYINANYAPTASIQPWTVNNGILTITAAPAPAAIQPLIDGYQYTSGAISTYETFSQTYGYFEMRAELPAGQGLWPAFWLLPENGSWPPEIDAMEMLGNDPTTYYTSAHWGTASNEQNASQANTVPDTSAGFHTYGVDWEPNYITYYFDGQEVYQTPTPSDMNTPMYMVANLAVGGYWPGDVNSTTPFPAQMQIDFIRAYSSLPSWIADGSDPTDVNHTPAGTVPSIGGTGGTSSGTDPSSSTVYTAAASYTVPAGVTDVVLTGTAPQTVIANDLGDTITSNNYGSTIIGGTGNDTEIAGYGADSLTGGGGDNTFVFNGVPWNAGQITDFNVATDKLDLSAVLSAAGYTGSSPVADGYLSFQSDGAGNTLVYVTMDSGSSPWEGLITTLDNVAPTSITPQDYGASSSTSSGSTSTGGGSTSSSGGTTSGVVDTSAASYTVPAGVTDVVLTGTAPQTVIANNLGDTITSNDYGSTIIGGTGNDTEIAGHGADTLTGGAGSDTFVFDYLPWTAGQITDFTPGTDKLDLSGLFTSLGYTGKNPLHGWLSFNSDGHGDTNVYVDPHTAGEPSSVLITTLDNVSPHHIHLGDVIFH